MIPDRVAARSIQPGNGLPFDITIEVKVSQRG
jgi:hypothetical protein